MNIHIEETSAALAAAAAARIAAAARDAVANHGRFTIALSGGSTPRAAYELLGRPPYRDELPWERMHILWGDERFVPQDHPDSNARMTREAWLNHVAIPQDNIHSVPTALGDPQAAAAAYEQELRRLFELQPGQQPRFDMVLLGMGDDGHTASLFPATLALGEQQRLVVANYVDKLSAWRITLTAPAINAAERILFLIAGAGKAGVLREVLHGRRDPQRLPSQLIQPASGSLAWLIDRAAAALLE